MTAFRNKLVKIDVLNNIICYTLVCNNDVIKISPCLRWCTIECSLLASEITMHGDGGADFDYPFEFFFFTFNGLQCWRAKATIHSYRIKRFSGQACSPFHVRDTRIGLNTRYSAQRVSISSDDCRIAVDCKLSRGTNFTLKTIDCSGLIRGCMTITTIRIGAPDRLP